MNDKIKNFIHAHYISVPICIVLCIIAYIWFYASRTSNIDTTGIRNAQNELRHAREYNQQSIEYNQRVRDAVENSKTLNERTEERIDRSIELNSRTENAIDRGTELTAKARADAERAKTIIGQSRDILRTAEERNQKSESTTTK